MTRGTGFVLSGFEELVLVWRFVAIDTEVFRRARKLIDFFAIHLVTALACYLLMGAGQRKTSLSVKATVPRNLALKVLHFPAIGGMALGTGDPFKGLVKRLRVRRGVAGFAGALDYGIKEISAQGIGSILKLLPAHRLVTIKTMIFLMLAGNRKASLRVVIEAQVGFPCRLAVTRLAILEGATNLVAHFLAITVIVDVTAVASLLQTLEVEIRRRSSLIALVTLDTGGDRMGALQRKAGYIMAEICNLPVGLRVTAGTVAIAETGTKISSMLILVARQTFLRRQLGPIILDVVFAFRHMTFGTLHRRMGADQRITRLPGMIEFLNIFPVFRHMTGATFLAFELLFKEMDIVVLMTADTGVALTKKLGFGFTRGLILPRFRMAAGTFGPGVSPIELKTGALVIEVLLIDKIDIGIATFVLFVTVDTVLVAHQTMEMELGPDVLPDRFMAIDTQSIGYPAAGFVAFETVFVLKIFMAANQGSGCQEFV